jgi:hypothetical protein
MSAARPQTFATAICRRLRSRAVAIPETREGSSRVNGAFTVRGVNFLFLGEKPDHVWARVKLRDSLAAAESLEDPRVSVGKHGWLRLRLPADDPIDEELLARWLMDSSCNCAPKALVRQLGRSG